MASQITIRMIPSIESTVAGAGVDDIGLAPAVNVELITAVSVRCVGLIDTAADLSVLDESLFRNLGRVPQVSSVRTVAVGSTHDVNLYLIAVRITGDSEEEALTFDNVPIIVMRLHRPLLLIGRRGILDRLKVELDFTRRRVTLARPEDLQKEFPALAQEFSSLQSILDDLREDHLERVVLSLYWETEQFLDRLITEDEELRNLEDRDLRRLALSQKFARIAERKHISDRVELAGYFTELTNTRNIVAHSARYEGLQRARVRHLIGVADSAVARLRALPKVTQDEGRPRNVYIEARPKGRPEGTSINDYVVEDYGDHVLATFKTQREAIDWAKRNGHSALVARVRHLNDKKKPDHWRVT
jgi:hypothetical protein